MGPRRRRVTWSEGAHRELDEAIGYIAEESPRNAAALLERILEAAASLGEFSERGRILPELGDPSIRELQIEPYRLIYSVDEPQVVILGLLHGRRDFDRWGRADLSSGGGAH
jgi:toxin ParE1/3/4